MRIAYVCTDYNWKSFSVIRSIYETLVAFGYEVEKFSNMDNIQADNFDQVWVASSIIRLERVDVFTIVFGFSDPNFYSETRMMFSDFYCTNSLDIAREKSAYYFPPFGNSQYFISQETDREIDCVFLGLAKHRYIPQRVEMVDRLRAEGITVVTYGSDWKSVADHPDNRAFVEGEDLIRILNSAKLCLDLTTEKTSLSSRIFQASMCSTPVLTWNREDVRLLLEPNEEILLYSSMDEFVEVTKKCLQIPERLRKIGENARKRCLQEHDVTVRITNLIDYLKVNYPPKPLRSGLEWACKSPG